MSETDEGWRRVLAAFDEWIYYEGSEFMPWTGYFTMDGLQSLTHQERLGWLHNMIDEIIPGRVDKCKEAGVALEDFLPFMPHGEAIETVRSMIDLNLTIQDLMLQMSDTLSRMLDDYKTDGLDEVVVHLETLALIEEDIRHHMSLYSKGFGKLKSLGLEMPDDFD